MSKRPSVQCSGFPVPVLLAGEPPCGSPIFGTCLDSTLLSYALRQAQIVSVPYVEGFCY